MAVLQKLVSFFIDASFLVILVLPLAKSSQEKDVKSTRSQTSNKKSIPKLSPKLLFEITLHGFLLWVSMGFLMPVGILGIRMSHREQCGRRLKNIFYVHSISQAGAVMSIKNFNNSFNNHHQRPGVALYGIIWLQALVGFLRPQWGSKGGTLWFFVHWMFGTAISLLGIVNIYTGLQACHHKTMKSIRISTIVFTTEVSLIVFFNLFQDKWVYIAKQGVILGKETIRPSNQVISPSDKQKESNESC